MDKILSDEQYNAIVAIANSEYKRNLSFSGNPSSIREDLKYREAKIERILSIYKNKLNEQQLEILELNLRFNNSGHFLNLLLRECNGESFLKILKRDKVQAAGIIKKLVEYNSCSSELIRRKIKEVLVYSHLIENDFGFSKKKQ